MTVNAPTTGGTDRSPLEVLTRNATVLTTIIGVFVTANGVLTGCSNERLAKHTAFRQAVASEETYWKGLLDEYQKTFEPQLMGEGNRERREAKLFALNELASHTVPDFSEHDVPQRVRDTAQGQFKGMRDNLRLVLHSPNASGERVASTLALQDYNANEADKLKPASGSLLSETPAATTAAIKQVAPSTPTLATLVLTSGLAQGWDVDVFWCRNSSAGENFASASAAATALAEAARDGKAIATGVKLGRIRLRPLLDEVNQRPSYQLNGFVIRQDQLPGEAEAAAAIRTIAEGAQTNRYRVQPSDIGTRWYVSLFACAGGVPNGTITSTPENAVAMAN